jgi:hypothetical protein
VAQHWRHRSEDHFTVAGHRSALRLLGEDAPRSVASGPVAKKAEELLFRTDRGQRFSIRMNAGLLIFIGAIAVVLYEPMEFEVAHVPYEQRRDRLQKLLSTRSQFIFDARWNLRIDGACDETIVLKAAKSACQYLLRDCIETPSKNSETDRTIRTNRA